MMGAPATQEEMSSRSSQLRRKGTIASRYLEAIGFQCGGNLDAGNNAYRSTPIVKKHNDSTFDNHYHKTNNPKKNPNRAVRSSTVYDKISASTKAVDCSNRSIITASTAVMLDHSDSLSTTTATSPGGSTIGRFLRGSPQRVVNRRGRSPTPIKSGTNSIGSSASSNSSRSRSLENGTPKSHATNNDHMHLPGSRTTAPLSDGAASAPSTPTRFNQRRHQRWEGQRIRTRSWGDHTNRTISKKNGENREPITPITAKSIMGIDNTNSGSDYSYSDSRLGLTPPPNMLSTHAMNDTPSRLSSQSTRARGRGFPTNTNPRMPSGSPGPQPRSPRHAYSHAEYQEHGQSGLNPWSHTNPYSDHVEDAVKAVQATLTSSHKQSQSAVLEGGAPTERTKNGGSINYPFHLRRPSAGADEASPPSPPFHSEPTDSEAGAPTEVTKNLKFVDRPIHLRRPSAGDGGNELLLKNRSRSKNVDILSRVQSRFQNTYKNDQRQQHQHGQPNDSVKPSIPSLFDTQSSSVSSAYPEQKEGASALNLSPSAANEMSSRLSRHVENARKKSIWSPSASETTGTVNSIGDEANVISSLTTEIGSSQDQRIVGKPLASLLSAKTAMVEDKNKISAPKVGGLLRGPVGARVAALEAHYRKGNFTVRGARSQQDDKEKRQIEKQTEDPADDESFPDPILSLSHTMEDNNVQHSENDDGNNSDVYYADEGQVFDDASTNSSGSSGSYELYEDDDDESTLPEFNNDENEVGSVNADFKTERVAEFVAYNDRQSPNIDGVFQLHSRNKESNEKSKAKKMKRSANKKVHRSRARDRGGKSPIQLLYSSERLDENNNASIRESSKRSKSLGRTVATEEFFNGSSYQSFPSPSNEENREVPPRRSKSLSERRIDYQPMLSVKKAEAMRIIARKRRMKNENTSKQEASQKAMPRKIVMKNEISKPDDGSDVMKVESPSMQPSTPLDSSLTSTPHGVDQSWKNEAEEENLKSTRSREVPTKEAKASIKDKIRTYNLKKSPIVYTSIGILPQEKPSNTTKQKYINPDSSFLQKENLRNRNVLRNGVKEDKNEDGRRMEPLDKNIDHSNVKTKLMKLQRKSIWNRHIAEKGKNEDGDNASSKTDDYSVQSLREQFEQKKNSSPFDEDDDDRSVKSIREKFESPGKKETGETISNLKAKFERKPMGSRLSFTKNTSRNGSRGTQGSNVKGRGKALDEGSIREESDLTEHVEKKKGSEISNPKKQITESFELSKLQEEDPEKTDGINVVQTSPMFNSVHNRLNEWSKRRQIERKSIAIHPVERRQNGNESHQAIEVGPSDDKSTPPKTGMGTGNKSGSRNLTVFGAIETRQSPLRDTNRGIPGSHWTSQGATSDRDIAIKRKGTKESSSDSEYSDAVTLDPSFADVSNLSTPSAIRSLPSSDVERRSDTSGSSVLFESLKDKALSCEFDGTHGASSSSVARPQLIQSGRGTTTRKAFPKDSNGTYMNSTLTKAYKSRASGGSHTQVTEDSNVGVSQESGYNSENEIDSYNKKAEKADNIGHNDWPSIVSNNKLPVGGEKRNNVKENLQHPGSINQNPNDSRRSILSSRSPESSDMILFTPFQDSEASNRSMENTSRDVESSTRSIQSSDTQKYYLESSYSPVRYQDNRRTKTGSSNGSSGPVDNHREFSDSLLLSNHSFENPQPETDTNGRSSRSVNSSRQISESSYTSHSSRNHQRKTESPNRSTRSLKNSSPLSYREKATQFDTEDKNDHGSPPSSSRSYTESIGSSRRKEKSSPASQPLSVPPMPSPFDENYATIMESRHKMLIVRQRALLERRANRDKIQSKNFQQGFFGRTNPGIVDSSMSSPSLPYQDHRAFADERDRVEFNVPRRSVAYDPLKSPIAHLSEERQPRSPMGYTYSSRLVKENNTARVPKSPVASILSRMRPTFGRSGRRDKAISQKEAVIHRISAVRAARLRSNQVYGDTSGTKNHEASGAYRMDKVDPAELETIGNSLSARVPGYRYYPHDESIELKSRDDDQSLSTNESNAQEYAAKLSVD